MDNETALRRAVDRVSEAVESFARSKGWLRDQYFYLVTADATWGRINVEFAGSAYGKYGNTVSFEAYDEIMDFLEKDLGAEPDLIEALDVHLSGLYGYPEHLSPVQPVAPDQP